MSNSSSPSPSSPAASEFWATPIFFASLSSVGTAAALAAAGAYLHRLGYIDSNGKTSLARFSQQVGLPALFFSKMVACPSSAPHPQSPPLLPSNMNASESSFTVQQQEEQDPTILKTCPGIWDSLSIEHAWLLMLWPFFVVSCGLLVGVLACWLSKTPSWQRRSIIVAVAFANSTGLPTTLLAALQEHSDVTQSSKSGLAMFDPDPSLVLSLYLVFYPLLQWSIGEWLLSPTTATTTPRRDDKYDTNGRIGTVANEHSNNHRQNENEDAENVPLVLNVADDEPNDDHHSIISMSNGNLDTSSSVSSHYPSTELPLIHHRQVDTTPKIQLSGESNDDATISTNGFHSEYSTETGGGGRQGEFYSSSASSSSHDEHGVHGHRPGPSFCGSRRRSGYEAMRIVGAFLYKTVLKQPPVCGALLGLLVASYSPLRRLFVVEGFTILPSAASTTAAAGAMVPALPSHAPPFKWLLDAISTLGDAAVPINMTVLGVNLSIAATDQIASTASTNHTNTNRETRLQERQQKVSYATIFSVVIGKLIIMPLLGFLSVSLLLLYTNSSFQQGTTTDDNNSSNNNGGGTWMRPASLASPSASELLVLMMVFLTPTSNTVMVMVDLADGLKEEMARIMAWQYVFAPFILSCTVAVAVSLAESNG